MEDNLGGNNYANSVVESSPWHEIKQLRLVSVELEVQLRVANGLVLRWKHEVLEVLVLLWKSIEAFVWSQLVLLLRSEELLLQHLLVARPVH